MVPGRPCGTSRAAIPHAGRKLGLPHLLGESIVFSSRPRSAGNTIRTAILCRCCTPTYADSEWVLPPWIVVTSSSNTGRFFQRAMLPSPSRGEIAGFYRVFRDFLDRMRFIGCD
jgi:hypothetical protein